MLKFHKAGTLVKSRLRFGCRIFFRQRVSSSFLVTLRSRPKGQLKVSMTVPAALDTFVVLAKSTTGAACADLIKQATSANGVYTFTPLLESENIQKVHSR